MTMTTARQLWDAVRSYILTPIKLSDMHRWFREMDGVPITSSATSVPVNEDTALTVSAVWNAVQIIAGTVGSLPLHLYKRTADGDREIMRDHPLYSILHDEPNPEMSAMDFRETMQAHVLTWGNAYAEIQRNGANQIAGLWPLMPARVSVQRDGGGTLFYSVYNQSNASTRRIEAADMLHVKGWGPDGVLGYSVIGKARQSLGYTMATEGFGSAFYGNATIHGGVVKHPGRLSEQAHTRLLHDLEARHKGGPNAFKLAILEEGMSWESMGMPLSDAQFLESRIHQIQEVARWFNIPLHMLKELTHATFSNIEHQALEFVQHTLAPLARQVGTGDAAQADQADGAQDPVHRARCGRAPARGYREPLPGVCDGAELGLDERQHDLPEGKPPAPARGAGRDLPGARQHDSRRADLGRAGAPTAAAPSARCPGAPGGGRGGRRPNRPSRRTGEPAARN